MDRVREGTSANLVGDLLAEEISTKTEEDPDWEVWSATYNRRIPIKPAVVVLPRSPRDIRRAVMLARKYGIKVQARSGGHSYASHSNGGIDGAMVIDLRQLHEIMRHEAGVIVGGGARLGNMARAIYDISSAALPHGTCAGVGVGGHLTHGGFGFFSRAWGLAMDRIRGMGVITADGRDVWASETENPELYYAMRGAGDSFGIVHQFHLKPKAAPESVVHFCLKIPGVAGQVWNSVKAFQAIQTFVHNPAHVDRRLGLSLSLSRNYFAIDGTYLGSNETLRAILSALIEEIESVTTTTTSKEDLESLEVELEVEEVSWLESLRKLNQGEGIETDPWTYEKHDNFYAKSVVIPEPGFNDRALMHFFAWLVYETPKNGRQIDHWILIDLWGGADSQIAKKDMNFSAFAHRDTCWVAQIYGYTSGDKEHRESGIKYINSLADAMTRHLPRFGAYANYSDSGFTREEAHKQYYGFSLHERLKRLKEIWDPEDVFSNPHSIEKKSIQSG
ncbi:putative glucooligosaccharide oxidase [Hypoxylon sp. FL1150]|nr:putative glucooligosaccharide oxidase [Hypoxylon sp. FL1150]